MNTILAVVSLLVNSIFVLKSARNRLTRAKNSKLEYIEIRKYSQVTNVVLFFNWNFRWFTFFLLTQKMKTNPFPIQWAKNLSDNLFEFFLISIRNRKSLVHLKLVESSSMPNLEILSIEFVPNRTWLKKNTWLNQWWVSNVSAWYQHRLKD